MVEGSDRCRIFLVGLGEKGVRSIFQSGVDTVEDTTVKPVSFLEISAMQKEVLVLHKLQDHAYE